MRVRIIEVRTNQYVDALIRKGDEYKLPSIHEGWRFNFDRHAKGIGAQNFVLVAKESPTVIEGCLIFKMLNDLQPYMAFIEIAPHNRGHKRKYDLVAGCLIAFACRLSFIYGKGNHEGWLGFDVHEPTEEDKLKLLANYSKKYRAKWMQNTTSMFIMPEDGKILREIYLGEILNQNENRNEKSQE